MWPDLIQKAKEGGLDVIQTYVFWNGHEPAPGKVMKSIVFLRKKNLFSWFTELVFLVKGIRNSESSFYFWLL